MRKTVEKNDNVLEGLSMRQGAVSETLIFCQSGKEGRM